MMSKYVDDDPVLDALGDLQPLDVDIRRAERLRARCRAVLATRARARPALSIVAFATWARATGVALLVAWCAIYVIQIARLGAVVWGL